MPRKFNKQVFQGLLLVTAFALGIFAFSGCIGQEEEEMVITLISGWAGDEMEAFMPILDVFTEDTGITVNYVVNRAEDLATILPAQFAAQRTPADVIFMWSWWINEKMEHIVDISDSISPIASEIMPGVVDQVTIDEKIYGAPYTGKLKPGFWYRRSFFDTHGLEAPTTWDDFVALLDTIQGIAGIEAPIASGDGVGWPLSDVTEHFLLTFGGTELFAGLKDGSVSWTGAQVTDIFENRLVPLLSAGHFSEPKDWTLILEDWWAGKHALYFMGSWITGMVEDPNDLGVFALPGAEAFVFNPDFCFVPKYSKHQTEAADLAKFLSGAEAQTLQVAEGGHIATNLGVSLEDYPVVDKRVAELLEGAAAVYDLDDFIGGEFQQTFWDQLKLLWVQPADMATVLANIEAKAP